MNNEGTASRDMGQHVMYLSVCVYKRVQGGSHEQR